MRVVQISDTHVTPPGGILFGGYDPAAALGAVLARVARLRPRPDLVFFTGDLTENGLPEEYAQFLRLLDGFDLPMAAIPGNHDRRDAFVAALAGSPVAVATDPSFGLQLVIDQPPFRLIGLDTLGLEGESAGKLDDQRLGWLARQLEGADGAPVVIFMHHPPIVSGLEKMDVWRLADPEPLAEIVARHPNVLRICCGHLHRGVEARFAGTVCGICPPVGWTVPLFDPAVTATVIRQDPAFQLHILTAEGVTTHTEFLADFRFGVADDARL